MKRKQFILLFMLIFLCFNSFSAIVSDNDGSAFVTKAEFDALKASFNNQIINYNNSIDRKIDGSIAEYLSGLKLSSTADMKCNISEFSFPVTLIGHLTCIESLYPTTTQVPSILKINYDVYSEEHNRGVGLFDYFNYTAPTINPYWLSGDWSSGKFVVNGNCAEPTLGITGYVIADEWGDTVTAGTGDTGHQGLAMDYYYDGQIGTALYWDDNCGGKYRYSVSGGAGSDTGKTKRLLNEGEVFGKISVSDFTSISKVQLVSMRSDNKTPYYWATGADLDKWPSGATKRVMADRIRNFNSNKYLSWSFDSVYDSKIKYIYNINDTQVADTSRKKLYVAPSLYNNGKELYLTNRKQNRVSLTKTDKSKIVAYQDRVLVNTSTNAKGEKFNVTGFEGVITTGLNIESEYNAISGHTYNENYSAVSTSDLVFNFLDSKKSSYQHYMTNGIPILSIPTGISDGLSFITVTIKITSEKSTTISNPKYICFSNKPIDKSIYDGTDVDKTTIKSMDLYTISSAGSLVVDTDNKLCKLNEGENIITIKDKLLENIRTGDVIYAKIYFDDTTEQYITIDDAPTFTLGIIN